MKAAVLNYYLIVLSIFFPFKLCQVWKLLVFVNFGLAFTAAETETKAEATTTATTATRETKA